MRPDRVALKAEARAAMRGRRPSVYLVSFGLLALNYVISSLMLRLQLPGFRTDDLARVPVQTAEQLQQVYAAIFQRMLTAMEHRNLVSWLLTVALLIFSVMLAVGFTSYCLQAARRQEAGFSQLFDGFGNLLRILALSVLRAFLIFLWSLPAVAAYVLMLLSVMNVTEVDTLLAALSLPLLGLGIVLGFIAHYRYSMAVYVLLDAPDKGPMRCLRDSSAMTRGHKGDLLFLDLSLLGWRIISQLPFVSIYTRPYTEIVWANFYRTLSGQMDPPEHVDIVV